MKHESNKSTEDENSMKKEMLEGIDMRKWICVSAEKLWVTNYNDVIFFVMSSEEWGKPKITLFPPRILLLFLILFLLCHLQLV